MADIARDQATSERRREAFGRGRKGIGVRLEMMFQEVVNQPVPGYWLALLQAAEHKTVIREEDAETRRRGRA